MTKPKNPRLSGATAEERQKRFVNKVIAAHRDHGVKDADDLLSRTALTTANRDFGDGVSALEYRVISEESIANARKSRKEQADAWHRDFEEKAAAKWGGQSDASHWTVKKMAAELREEWNRRKGRFPCKQLTAQKFLSPIHAKIRRRRR